MRRTIIQVLAAAAIAGASVTPGAVLADPHEHGHDHGDKGDSHDNGKHKGWDKHRDEGRAYDDRRRDDRRYDARRYDARRYDDRRNFAAYDYNRPDPRYGEYRADRYYRQGSYAPRAMRPDERIYRGGDGRYYCRRNDGTTGLVIGAVGGGALGNIIAPGGSKTLGTVLGALGGGLIGRGIDRGNVTCR